MRLLYLLDRPELGGGTKVVVQQARLLRDRGHDVTIAAQAPRAAWLDPTVPFVDLSQAAARLPAQDLVVATYWTTIARAETLGVGPVAHFCQGFEADLEHLAPQRAAIQEAYRRPHPALVVAPHLGQRLRAEFGREFRLSPAPADRSVVRRRLWMPYAGPRRRPWIALCGIFEAEVKGIRCGLEAIAELERRGVNLRLLRLSALPQSPAERELYAAGRYLEAVPPVAALRALAACDLLLFTSRRAEGFGLPLLEAMQLGVPAVASRIPGVEFMTGGAGASLVEEGDALAAARAAESLLASPRAWRAQRRQGLAAAGRFAPEKVAVEVERALLWALAAATATVAGGAARP